MSVTDSKIPRQQVTSIRNQGKEYHILDNQYDIWKVLNFLYRSVKPLNPCLCRFCGSQTEGGRIQCVQKEESSGWYCSGLRVSRFRSCSNRYCSACIFLSCTRSEVQFTSVILSDMVPRNRESYNYFSEQAGMICCEHTKTSLLGNESIYSVKIKCGFFLHQQEAE